MRCSVTCRAHLDLEDLADLFVDHRPPSRDPAALGACQRARGRAPRGVGDLGEVPPSSPGCFPWRRSSARRCGAVAAGGLESPSPTAASRSCAGCVRDALRGRRGGLQVSDPIVKPCDLFGLALRERLQLVIGGIAGSHVQQSSGSTPKSRAPCRCRTRWSRRRTWKLLRQADSQFTRP